MDRDNHYEAAFEAYLRAQQVPYVAVDEARRALWGDESLKSLDFIVSTPSQATDDPAQSDSQAPQRKWLVDVKGRRFPSGAQKQYWKNWSTQDDLTSLAKWQRLFGGEFASLFVFGYHVLDRKLPVPEEELFEYQGERYGFVGILLEDYAYHARLISPRWETVAMPCEQFRNLSRPMSEFLEPAGTSLDPAASDPPLAAR